MIKLEASFIIVTPLFMSGADRKRAELRAASIRGILRFWWRALALDQYKSWEEVRTAEFDLFGSSSGGQSRVHISLSAPEESKSRNRSGEPLIDRSGNVLSLGGRYLGYGVVDINGQASRPYLNPPLKFGIKIYLRPLCRNSSEKLSGEADLLEGALKAMGLIGGLGSRSRRGFGSITLLELKRDNMLTYEEPKDAKSYVAYLKLFLKNYVKNVTGVPEYTAFNQDSRIYILKTGSDPLQLLGEIGLAMQMYRSWGLNGMVNGVKPSQRIFEDDHHNMRLAFSGTAKYHPRRAAFGLPHNYFFSTLDRELAVLPEKHERRASPLFIHIHMITEREYVAVASIFPAKFLPDDERILIRPDHGNDQLKDLQSNWLNALTDFAEGNLHDSTGLKRFPDLEMV